MSENKDLAIKLFGKTIPLSLLEEVSTRESSIRKPDDGHSSQQNYRSSGPSPPEKTSATEQGGQREENEEFSGKAISMRSQEDDIVHQAIKDTQTPATTASDANENPETHLSCTGNSSLDTKSAEQNETGTSHEKPLKKPDKILACPRCNSMDTKFCYFNNYNINQPRHFCKKCQRYWTAGGTMRNVPIGSGRRKNKNASASHYRHLMVPQISPTAQLDVANGVHNGLLTFGSDTRLCDSLPSALNLADKMNNVVGNDIHQLDQKALVSSREEDIREDHSSGTFVTVSGSTERRGHCNFQESVCNSYQAFPAQVPCIPGSAWPFAMKSTQWSPALPPASSQHAIPVSFYPAPAYWGCTLPSSFNVPCIPRSSSSVNKHTSGPDPNSATLGKHSRDGDELSTSNLKQEEPNKVGGKTENYVLVPKTLRIDDPTEAAKSSIWEALGIKNEKANSTHVRSLFNRFQTKAKDKNHVVEPSALLQVNPAAFSRSLSFREST